MTKHLLALTAILALASCYTEAPKKIPLSPLSVKPVTDENGNLDDEGQVELGNSKADIVFVIDNSPSMNVHQVRLADNIDQFVAEFSKNKSIDWRIAAITTDMESILYMGKFVGSPSFVTPQTPDYVKKLKNNLHPGDRGAGTEKVFDPLRFAISDSLTKPKGWNSGFFRPDAALVVIVLIDTDDQTNDMSIWDVEDMLVKFKGGNHAKVQVYGALGTIELGCRGFGEDYNVEPIKITELIKLFNGAWYDLCDKNFGALLSKIAIHVSDHLAADLSFNKKPVIDTIRVSYGTQVIPQDPVNGWIYDPEKNALKLGSNVKLSQQPPGTRLDLQYLASEIPLKFRPNPETIRVTYGSQTVPSAPQNGWVFHWDTNILRIDPLTKLAPEPKGTIFRLSYQAVDPS